MDTLQYDDTLAHIDLTDVGLGTKSTEILSA